MIAACVRLEFHAVILISDLPSVELTFTDVDRFPQSVKYNLLQHLLNSRQLLMKTHHDRLASIIPSVYATLTPLETGRLSLQYQAVMHP